MLLSLAFLIMQVVFYFLVPRLIDINQRLLTSTKKLTYLEHFRFLRNNF